MRDYKVRPFFTLASAVLTTCLTFTSIAHAETLKPDIKPGLWQHDINFKTESGQLERALEQLEQQLAAMPAAQRDMVKKMMANQGLSFDLKGASVKACLTQENINNGQLPQQEGCEQTVTKTGDNTFNFSFVCQGNPPSKGSGVMTVHNPESYSGNANFTTEVNGKPEAMIMQQTGTWIGSSCGNL
ncbi:DUF3617 domain-containing protein [Rheinheimera sp. WS51]|uniref:DUF3617 domain-containing protein n=1 Tax=Rheinheimera sp. WS51 TaxID=3425886 RepID=UPI003D8BE57F